VYEEIMRILCQRVGVHAGSSPFHAGLPKHHDYLLFLKLISDRPKDLADAESSCAAIGASFI
jgi:hypothetical protein